MRSTFSSAAAVVAALTPLASAVINITMDTSNGVTVGHEYPVIITSDTDYYTSEFVMVQQRDFGWQRAGTIFEGRMIPVGTWQYIWTAPEDVSEKEKYALWLSGELKSPNTEGSSGYANLTEWFSISGGQEELAKDLH